MQLIWRKNSSKLVISAEQPFIRLICLFLYSHISPRREVPSCPVTPAPSPSSHTPNTPTPPYDPNSPTVIEEHALREREAYEALIRDGGQPTHPIEIGLKVLDEPGICEDIISYWKLASECGREPFLTQLRSWEVFRKWQDQIRKYYVSQNRFSEYPQYVNERRRRFNLEANADLRPERIQQSRLDDWLEYQNFQLHRREKLESQIKEAEQVLDAAQKEFDEAENPEIKVMFKQVNYDISEDFLNNQRARNVIDLRQARRATKYAEREVELSKNPYKFVGTKEMVPRTLMEAVPPMTRLENSKKIENKYLLRAKVLDAAECLVSFKKNLKWNKFMVDWVEQQRPVIASRWATSIDDTEGNNNQGLAQKSRSQNHSESSLLLPQHHNNGSSNGQKENPRLAHLVHGRPPPPPLTPHDSEVSKFNATKRTLSPRRMIISRKRNQSAEPPITEPSSKCKRRKSERIANMKAKKLHREIRLLSSSHHRPWID